MFFILYICVEIISYFPVFKKGVGGYDEYITNKIQFLFKKDKNIIY